VTSQRRRAWGVVIATLLALILVPFAVMSNTAQAAPGGNGNGNGNGGANGNGGNGNGNGGNGNGRPTTTTTACSYPSNNCPTTTTRPGPRPVIVLDLTVAVPGQLVRLRVCGYAPGTVIVLTLDGVIVGQITVGNQPPQTCTAQNASFTPAVIGPLSKLFAQPGTSGAEGSFTVPTDEHPGSHTVCAVDQDGSTAAACTSLKVASGASVLGTTFSNGGAPLVSSNNGDSFLAFTGLGLIRLMLLAGVLIAAGLFLVRRDRVRHA
jgi:hypothetical protein